MSSLALIPLKLRNFVLLKPSQMLNFPKVVTINVLRQAGNIDLKGEIKGIKYVYWPSSQTTPSYGEVW